MTYLLIDIGTLFVPLIFSFHPRLRFDRQWKAFWPANLLVAFVFLVWDGIFTQWGVWGFSPTHLMGIGIFGLPLEEILFFVCIPYACVFTYYCLGVLFPGFPSRKPEPFVSGFLILLCFLLALFHPGRLYTFWTFLPLGLLLLFIRWFWNPSWLMRFYFAYLVLLLPFFIVNGMLTGTGFEDPVVWYNDQENLGIRIGTVPVEDVFYGLLLILLNVVLFEFLKEGRVRWGQGDTGTR